MHFSPLICVCTVICIGTWEQWSESTLAQMIVFPWYILVVHIVLMRYGSIPRRVEGFPNVTTVFVTQLLIWAIFSSLYKCTFSKLYTYYVAGPLGTSYGAYLQHPQFFILICNILSFTSFQFHPQAFISIYTYYLFHSLDFILISSS